ncbi:hypothetical protein WN943_027173 [Citrus x changshan-huyou]
MEDLETLLTRKGNPGCFRLEVANSLEEIMEEALEEPPMQPSFVYPAANMYAGNASLNSEQAFTDSTQGTAAASHANPNAFTAISQGAAAAPLANYNVVAYSSWYIDLGATNHVTQDAGIFLSCSRYTGQEHRIILLKGIARDGLYQIEGLTIVSASDKPYVLLSSKSMSTIPWIFYHKLIGVSNFFLFVEGRAASPAGVKVLYRTRELEEQQAKSHNFEFLNIRYAALPNPDFCLCSEAYCPTTEFPFVRIRISAYAQKLTAQQPDFHFSGSGFPLAIVAATVKYFPILQFDPKTL